MQQMCVANNIDEGIVRRTFTEMGYTTSQAASILGDVASRSDGSRSTTSSSSILLNAIGHVSLMDPVTGTAGGDAALVFPRTTSAPSVSSTTSSSYFDPALFLRSLTPPRGPPQAPSTLFDSQSPSSRNRQERYLAQLSAFQETLEQYHNCPVPCTVDSTEEDSGSASVEEATPSDGSSDCPLRDPRGPMYVVERWRYRPECIPKTAPPPLSTRNAMNGWSINREPVGRARSRLTDPQQTAARLQRTAAAEVNPRGPVMRPQSSAGNCGGRVWVPTSLPRRERCDRVRLAQYYCRKWECQSRQAVKAQNRAVLTTRAVFL